MDKFPIWQEILIYQSQQLTEKAYQNKKAGLEKVGI